MKKSSRFRRAFFTMHAAHLSDEYVQMAKNLGTEHAMRTKFHEIKTMDMPKQLRAIAVQLEMGKETERIHIQGYLELTSARSWSYYGKMFDAMETCFQTVKDGPGSWAYCTSTGQHEGKAGVLDQWQYGEPALHGGSENRADLKTVVNLIVEGYHPAYILKKYPYAYTVHRTRLWSLWKDLQEVEQSGYLSPIGK
jgi:hypothetical protein